MLKLDLRPTYFCSTVIRISSLCQVQSYLSNQHQQLTYNLQTMAHRLGHAPWLDHRQAPNLHQGGASMAVGLAFAAAYIVGMLIAITWGLDKVNQHQPEDIWRLPRCYSRHYLRFPLLIVWPGLLWPFFLFFVCLRWNRDQRRANGLFQDDANNGVNPSNVRNNQEYMPLNELPPHDQNSEQEDGNEGTSVRAKARSC